MKETVNKNNEYFEELLRMGLVSTGSQWIRRAVAQKHASIPVGVADSKLLTYDNLDRKIVALARWN